MNILIICKVIEPFLSTRRAAAKTISTYLVPSLCMNNTNFKRSLSILSIPFIDDFSYFSTQADSNLWQDNSVFINRNYGINPITIGVATFDGLNRFGRPYNLNLTGTDSENADTLTSQQIDLSDADTAYFMFYYQPQGLGNDPQLPFSFFSLR